jgi:hypothetical protein
MEVVVPDAEDVGQYLGTLFEARDPLGRVVAAAGFVSGAQTSAINDHRTLHFFLDPPLPQADLASKIKPKRLPGRPYGASNLFRLATLSGQLIAYPRNELAPIRLFSRDRWKWEDWAHPLSKLTKTLEIVSLQVVEDQALSTFVRDIFFAERAIDLSGMPFGFEPVMQQALYANGRLLVSVVDRVTPESPRRAAFVDCAWKPRAHRVTACQRADFTEVSADPGPGHVVLGMHPLADGRVLLYGLAGFFYIYDRGALKPLVEIGDVTGWQIYSTLDRYSGVVIGHYPSANLMRLSLADLPAGVQGWSADDRQGALISPPIVESKDVLRTEAQSLMVFKSSLLVGMWPWGELFVGTPGNPWHLAMASPIEATSEQKKRHPYEEALRSTCLGMRIFQLIPWEGGIAYQTTVLNEDRPCQIALANLDPIRGDPYGRVNYINVPGSMSCALPWTRKPRKIRLSITQGGEMAVDLDGARICSRPIEHASQSVRAIKTSIQYVRPAIGLYGRRTPVSSELMR